MIIVGYPGIGKSTIARKHYRFIDLESSLFKIDGERSDNWYKAYCAVAEDLSRQDHVVFVSSHSAVRETLRGSQEVVVVIYPSIDLKDEWIRKLEERYLRTYSNGDLANANKDRMAYARAKKHYTEDISELENCDIPFKICLKSMDYSLEEELSQFCDMI